MKMIRAMQTIKSYKWIAGYLILLTACSGKLTDDVDPEDKGEPVNISFDMYSASLTKADEASTEDMAPGKTFRIYAYNSVSDGLPDFSKPLASSVYTVGDKGIATGNLSLYRGTYYMYLVSYNSESQTPELDTGKGTINVKNEHDFMYTTLENIVVQPESAGGNHMTVSLPAPFKRLGSQVVVKVAAKNITQPVDITTLTVEDIKIGGLPASLTYELGKTTWNDCDAYTAFYQYPKESFTRPDDSKYSFWSSTPVVLLPVVGSTELTFDVNLTVTYDSGTKSLTQVYPASIQKVLAPGMTYEFEFTLTFYGAIVATDLTLAVREYNTITLDNKDDSLGK